MQQKTELSVQEYCANMLKSLHDRGISAIPLNGKRPHFSVKWKQFQSTIPPKHLSDEWVKNGFISYGIICGRISQGIIVIDFDSCDLYEGFCRYFHYISTYTVKTRRGFHIYLKTKFHVAPRQFEDCDIKGDGGYVVGAGSVIDGHSYCASQQCDIQTITHKQYIEIIKWLSPKPTQTALPIQNHKTTNMDLIATYDRQANKIGRNNALYSTAIQARKNGISIEQVMHELAPYHATKHQSHNHRPETPQQRLQEARRTIKSAYQSNKQIQKNHGLTNSIRETLLQKQLSAITPRFLDTLRLLKKDKQWITLKELLEVSKQCHLSKKSIFRVLIGDLSKIDGKRVFKRYNYKDVQDNIDINVSQDDMGKPKLKRGRSIKYIYKIPSNYYLSNILKIDIGFGDQLKLGDLKSADVYRKALHRELIRRLSPMVRVDWLAKRLGVNRRTIFRYNIQLNIQVNPMIQKQALTQELVTQLADGNDDGNRSFTPGIWIETKSGRRYPAIKSIANNLVSDRLSVAAICRQLPSKYTLPENSEEQSSDVELPEHLKSRATLLTYETIQTVLAPDWATEKYDLGGYLAVYNGYEWTFKPPLRVVAYPLVKKYDEGLIYYIRPLKS